MSHDYKEKGQYITIDGMKTCTTYIQSQLLLQGAAPQQWLPRNHKMISQTNCCSDHTGPSDAKHAILIIYDIFGFFPQTLQGADILATSDDHRKYQVFMPDWFEGHPADISWYPPDNDEKKQKLGEFFAGPAAPAKTVARVPKVVDEIVSKVKGFDSWAILGFCWGGKVHDLFMSGRRMID